VKDISNVGQVACGSSHTLAVSQDGRTVWSFGGGDNGETCRFCFSISTVMYMYAFPNEIFTYVI
jgi:alpha-tubulin suppressor-like RCC1 family protein